MLRRTLQNPSNKLAQSIFLRPFDFSSNKQLSSNAYELNDQQRTTVTSNLGRMRVNMSRVTKKIDDMLHPHPDSKVKKYQLKKRYVRPVGETLASQLENNTKMNPAGVKKPHKTTERNLELIKAIYECGNTHQPDLAIDAYRRLSAVPDIKCFNALIKSFELNGDFIGEAFQIYQDMKKIRSPANINTFLTLLNVCVAANHWQRAMYVLKEMLNIAPPPARPDKKQHKKFFAKLLQLLYKNEQHERIAYVYKIMLENGCLSNKATHKSAPVEFVQNFIPKLADAQVYLTKTLAGLLEPSKGFTFEANDSNMEFHVHPLAANLKAELESAQRDVIEVNEGVKSAVLHQNPLEFNFEMEDRTAQKQFKSMCNALVNEFVPDFVDPLVNPEEPVELYIEDLRDVPQAKARAALTEKKLQMYVEKWAVSHDVEAVDKLEAAYNEEVKAARDALATKLPWKPVIVGVDGKPFFPSKISVHKITGESVKAAKQEYLDSIEDQATRKEVEEKLKDRIRLCWYSEKTGKLVQGLFY